ncbi:ankyrin repeat-containing domain protein [Microdochium bolleyi]|uniref:Ankyrin repeat-containing domain protein n=1 Tax=Microdochium bolleyi TaxID=196109 RepID=A0A136IRR7_9PEZI|nr:ankyrin repeat-containing domain protein [Microdochium bolleyi]
MITRQFQVLSGDRFTRRKQEWHDLLPGIIKAIPIFGNDHDYFKLFWTWHRLALEVCLERKLTSSSPLGPTSCSYMVQACKSLRFDVGKALVQDLSADASSLHDGSTALEWLCISMKVWGTAEEDFVLFLVQHGASMESSHCLPILCGENFLGDLPIKFFLEHGSLADEVADDGETPLHILCSVEAKVEYPIPPSQRLGAAKEVDNSKGLFQQWDKYERSARLLLEYGAKVNAISITDGQTPLHRLSSSADRLFPLASLLVEYGGDLRLRDAKGRSPVFLACCNPGLWHSTIVSFLTALEPNLPDLDDSMESPLFELVLRAHEPKSDCLEQSTHGADIADALGHVLGMGFDIDSPNIHGETALYSVCSRPAPSNIWQDECIRVVVEKLLAMGADPGRVPASGMTCLHHLARHARRGALAALIGHADTRIDALTTKGVTPLFEAVLPCGPAEKHDTETQKDRLHCVDLLVMADASVVHRNSDGLDVFDVVRAAAGWYNKELGIQARLEGILNRPLAGQHVLAILEGDRRHDGLAPRVSAWLHDLCCCFSLSKGDNRPLPGAGERRPLLL